jgi:hypothetical protein
VTHEVGHAYDHAVEDYTGALARFKVSSDLQRPNNAWEDTNSNDEDGNQRYYGYAGGHGFWQFGSGGLEEEFADMFVGWAYNTWGQVNPYPNGSPSPYAKRGKTMEEIMITSLSQIVRKYYHNDFYFK